MPGHFLRALAAVVLLAAAPAAAQRPTPIPPPPTDPTVPADGTQPASTPCDGIARRGCPPARFLFGASVDVAQPVGEFREHADVAAGLNLSGIVLVRPGSPLGFMLNGGFISYGSDERDVRIAAPFGGSFVAELGTSYTYAGLQAGPELAVRAGAVRPYLAGTIGFGSFRTRSALTVRDNDPDEGEDETDELWSRTHSSDAVLAMTGLAGLRIALGSSGSPVTLDAGARFVHNGEASYVRRGDIIENDDGTMDVTVTRSRADFVSYTLGVSIGFGSKR